MDLSLDDFTEAFLDSEIQKVSLNTMNGDNIYLRSLGRADITRFQRYEEEIQSRLALNIITRPDISSRIKDTDLADAKDYLVFKAMCKVDGDPLFDDLKHYKKWSKSVLNTTIEEILWNINNSLKVFYDPSVYEPEIKKKEKSS